VRGRVEQSPDIFLFSQGIEELNFLVSFFAIARYSLEKKPSLLPSHPVALRSLFMPSIRVILPLLGSALLFSSTVHAEEPLHSRIDKLILAKADGKAPAAISDDAEFLRRVSLDFSGKIPSVEQARAFLADRSPRKRAELIDRLLASPDYAERMTDLFHVFLMERLGEHQEWAKYLKLSFEKNKPWNQMVREILRADPADEANRGAAFWYAKRLENYGENPVDYPALTRDVGRLFLGKNLQCAQCHDHLFIDDYKQQHFQGLFAFVRNAYLSDSKAPTVGEKPTTEKVNFMSVFKKVPKATGPAVPGGKEFDPPPFKKGEEYIKAPDPKSKTPPALKFSPLAILAEQLPAETTPGFSHNIVNRLWFMLMGRGIVHPLDLHHSANPPSHPELLDLLAREFVAHRYDIKWLLRELALSDAYQRSSVLSASSEAPAADKFLNAIEKRLSAEQLMWSMLQATGERDGLLAPRKNDKAPTLEQVRAKFIKAFGNPVREPEDEFAPSLNAALFLSNDPLVLGWLSAHPGNTLDRLSKLTDADKIADELYLSVLTRLPTAQERQTLKSYLSKEKPGPKDAMLSQWMWALLASTEFCVNH